jgi:endogenous inhibitor of DNA gyrase (YacG/DUF329 family)
MKRDLSFCVFCRIHPVDPAWRPFCSERCKLQDLSRWVDGAYRVPDDRVDDAEEGDPE